MEKKEGGGKKEGEEEKGGGMVIGGEIVIGKYKNTSLIIQRGVNIKLEVTTGLFL